MILPSAPTSRTATLGAAVLAATPTFVVCMLLLLQCSAPSQALNLAEALAQDVDLHPELRTAMHKPKYEPVLERTLEHTPEHPLQEPEDTPKHTSEEPEETLENTIENALWKKTRADNLSNEIKPLTVLSRSIRDVSDQLPLSADYYPELIQTLSYDYPADELEYDNHRNPRFVVEQPPAYQHSYTDRNNGAFNKFMSEFGEDGAGTGRKVGYEGMKKRVLSSFRERMEKEKSKEQHEKMAEVLLKKLEEEERDAEREYETNRDYMEMLEELSEKYRTSHPDLYMRSDNNNQQDYMVEGFRKRQLPIDYSSLGWNGVGYRKRSYSADIETPNDALDFINYSGPSPQEEDDDVSERYDFLKNNQDPYRQRYVFGNRNRDRLRDRYRERSSLGSAYEPDLVYAKRKRFPVAKRSSNFYGSSLSHHKTLKDSKLIKKDAASGTDPKIVKDLSSIFGTKETNSSSSDIKVKKTLKKSEKNIKTTQKAFVTESPGTTLLPTSPYNEELHHHIAKERIVSRSVKSKLKDMPLKIKKKSIDWSKYFGIDKRKKKSGSYFSDNNVDNGWMLERYHNSAALASKRSVEYPLKMFRNRESFDEPKENKEDKVNGGFGREMKKNDIANAEEAKLSEMDVKLKNMEDIIIDEALKYTGAHEGSTDSKEVQEVKDKVISRLAAAYSLEKMRRALSEFKTSMAAQKYAIENKTNKNIETPDGDKDVALEKKDVDQHEYGPENKKCENCDEQLNLDFTNKAINDLNPFYSAGVKNSISGNNECDVIEQRCRSILSIEHGSIFYPLCKWHQMCYLCGGPSEESLTACDVMLLNKADALCQRDMVCQWSARATTDYLRNLFQSGPTELSEGCPGSPALCGSPPDAPESQEYNHYNHLLYNIR